MTLVHTHLKTNIGWVNSSIIIGAVVFILAYIACYKLEETFHKDLNYNEE
jgi:hypothetical protein